ncbi:hypothetical protein BDFB_013673 [Asbolus verrucosus]|uniref:Uncharacterized protein n=1 Tax=Asbolus verrucosus TaxID=1661398 RepID=A0A482VTA3_ASBVE|nr:hypothetical protein BDFB_013673 [Asbolus verrucosus]
MRIFYCYGPAFITKNKLIISTRPEELQKKL